MVSEPTQVRGISLGGAGSPSSGINEHQKDSETPEFPSVEKLDPRGGVAQALPGEHAEHRTL
jgi:hypothetical protein